MKTKINNTYCHCEEGFSPTTLAPHCVLCSAGEQSHRYVGDCHVATNAPRNDMTKKEGAL